MHSISNASPYTHNSILNCTMAVCSVSMYNSRVLECNVKLKNYFKETPTFMSTDPCENINSTH